MGIALRCKNITIIILNKSSVPPANSSLPYPVVLPIGALGASRAGYERVSDLDQT
jgi:hypothetical protein